MCLTYESALAGDGWSDELKLQSIDKVDEDDLDEDGKFI